MKRILHALIIALISAGVADAQSTAPSTFMERYYLIKDSYKDLEDAYGPFAACDYTLEEYMKRYYAFRDAYRALPRYQAQYAASGQTLADFEKKYYEVKKVYPE
ncbi:MAG TPA: hypothetical protein VEB42_11940, partial [Chitinophagaceae bacterium]|nr:hypothetical protein [Chitinophagaceae bacterium]